jgi:hypothetical protein
VEVSAELLESISVHRWRILSMSISLTDDREFEPVIEKLLELLGRVPHELLNLATLLRLPGGDLIGAQTHTLDQDFLQPLVQGFQIALEASGNAGYILSVDLDTTALDFEDRTLELQGALVGGAGDLVQLRTDRLKDFEGNAAIECVVEPQALGDGLGSTVD